MICISYMIVICIDWFMIVLVCYSLYCYVSSLIVCYVCMMYVYLYRTLTPYNLLPYNHNTYNAMVCDMRVYGHVFGIASVGHMLKCIDYVYILCTTMLWWCVLYICCVQYYFLYVIRLCITRFCAMFFRRIGCVQYN